MSAAGGNKKRESVTFKGTGGGLLIRLRDEADAPVMADMLEELETRLKQSAKFFKNAQASLDLGKREVEAADLETMREMLARYEIRLDSVVSGVNATRSAARQVGLPIRLPSPATTRPPVASETIAAGFPFDSAEALFVQRTLRSGQKIEHHSDVCLIGDVNPGAEIIAGGSVLVWGVLRGMVHAGAVEDKANGAMICAMWFAPTQIRIGELVTRGPATTNAVDFKPETALVREGRIVVEPWMRRK